MDSLPPPPQWRRPPPPPPPQASEICPTCSSHHFPFCPPPPPFPPNPDFPYHQRPPPYDPYFASPNPSSFQNPNPNPSPHFNSGYYRNNGGYPIQSRHHDYAPPPQYGTNGFADGSDGDRNSYKRTRIEDNFGGYSNETYHQVVFSDDERRLKLIRDHGGTGDAPPPGPLAVPPAPPYDRGVDNFTNGGSYTLDEYRRRGNTEMNRYSDAGSGYIGGADPIRQYGSNDGNDYAPGSRNMPNSVNYNTYSSHYGQDSQNTPYENSIQNGGSLGPIASVAEFAPPPPQSYSAYPTSNMQNDLKQPLRNHANVPFEGRHMGGLSNSSTHSSADRGSYRTYPRVVTPDSSHPPPLPTSPPPPLPLDPPTHTPSGMKSYTSPAPSTVSSLFPVPVASAGVASYHQAAPGSYLSRAAYGNKQVPDTSAGLGHREHLTLSGRMPGQYAEDRQLVSAKQLPLNKPTVVDASHIFKPPHRSVRPDHLVVILRGLPGSGKSYLAKMLRDIEVENGGSVPRIYSMDDYFMTEVEKADEADASKSSGSAKRKRPLMKKVMEYCYEPEMEEAYRSSMLKAYKKTVEDGTFTFIIVDDRNLRVADFAQFWAIGKASGYEVYILEATYKDPEGCAARNVHSFSLADIRKMAGQWEDTPSLYLQLDAKSLFCGDDLNESGIQEVDMDMDDGHLSIGGTLEADKDPSLDVETPSGFSTVKKWNAEGDNATEVRELGRSKWSEDLGEQEKESAENLKGSVIALSGLSQAHGKKRKSLRWGDQVGYTGFSIGAVKKANAASLIIGPGAGYNLKSNPLSKEEDLQLSHGGGEPKKRRAFQERLRAEHQSFKAVFDRRRQRIGGLGLEDE